MKLLKAFRNGWQSFRADLGGGTPSPDSDYWYHRPGFHSAAGTYVSPETAMRLAAVFACVRVISETIGSLPLAIYRRRADGGKERANDHPLYSVFQKPNLWQTSFEFWEMMQAHLELRGNAFAEILTGNGRAIDQLIPLHPDRVRVFRLANGRLRYDVTSYFDGTVQKLNQEQMFHLRGMSSDGIVGMSTITAAMEVIGTGLAQQEYGARFFHNDARPGLVLETANKLTPEARELLKSSWGEAQTGANAHKTAVLEMGLQAKVIGLTNKDSQLIEARQQTRTDVASMFRLPPHKIGDLTRGTFSNIEQQNIEFATDSIRPRIERLERRINMDLIDSLEIGLPGEFFADFNMDALFRGDMKSRYEAYNQALQFWLTVNEVRAAENLNPIEGGDELLRPVNMAPADSNLLDSNELNDLTNAAEDSGEDAPGTGDDEDSKSLRLEQLARSAAARIVRREVKALAGIRRKAASAKAAASMVRDFYLELVPIIVQTLVVPHKVAAAYVETHSQEMTAAFFENKFDQALETVQGSVPMLTSVATRKRTKLLSESLRATV